METLLRVNGKDWSVHSFHSFKRALFSRLSFKNCLHFRSMAVSTL